MELLLEHDVIKARRQLHAEVALSLLSVGRHMIDEGKASKFWALMRFVKANFSSDKFANNFVSSVTLALTNQTPPVDPFMLNDACLLYPTENEWIGLTSNQRT